MHSLIWRSWVFLGGSSFNGFSSDLQILHLKDYNKHAKKGRKF